MLHYYCFMVSADVVRPDQKIYKVEVRDNQRDQVKAKLIDLYSCDTNGYWRRWDNDTQADIDYRFRKFVSASALSVLGYRIIRVDVKTLYRHIIEGTIDTIENSAQSNLNFYKLNSMLFPRLYPRFKSLIKPNPAPSSKCKNLRTDAQYILRDSVIKMAIAAVLFLLGALLEGWEASLY